MIAPATPVAAAERSARLSRDDLGRLARTYDLAVQPVWVHGVDGQCLYRNQAAARTSPHAAGMMRFDVFDHESRPVARLCTLIH